MILDLKKDILNNEDFDGIMRKRNECILKSEVESLYEAWKSSQVKLEEISRHRNIISKSFSKDNIDKAKMLSDQHKVLEADAKANKDKFDNYMLRIPNLISNDVVEGKNADNNVEVYRNMDPEVLDSKHHEDILLASNFIKKQETVNMSGSRFMCLYGLGASFERKLGNLAIDKCIEYGFIEAAPPVLVHAQSMINTGQLPKFDGEYFNSEQRCLIPTSEVSLANLYTNTCFDLDDLPIQVVAFTPCFRKEAGSLGKDTKGLIRLHQFSKVEMFVITHQENSKEIHEDMINITTKILEYFELPYRIVSVCSGDMGFTAFKQFDVEVWMPSQKKYVEVASISNCNQFQSRRMKTKYRTRDNVDTLVHTLNGTAVAPGRVIASLVEHGYDLRDLI